MELKTILDSLDLTGYEKEIITALAETQNADAKTLYEKTAVPKGRIYSVLDELRHKGFVETIPTKPKKYFIKDIKQSIKNFLKNKRDEVDERMRTVEKLQLKPKPEKGLANTPTAVFFTGRKEHLREIIKLRDEAKTELLQIAPSFIGNNQTKISLDRALRRGVKSKIITSGITKENSEQLRGCINSGGEARVHPELDTYFLIKDSEELLLGIQNKKNNEERVIVLTRSGGLIAAMKVYFEKMWKESAKINKSDLKN